MAELSPVDWAKRPLQKYADFSGRAPRAEYWWYTLGVVIVALLIGLVEGILGLSNSVGPYGPLSLIFMLALLVPGLAVTARRLHDTDRSGWWMLIAVVPYALMAVLGIMAATSGSAMGALAVVGIFSIVALVGAVVLLVFMVLPGTRGPNKYGPDPYGADVEQVFA